jgi:transcription initiation factor TFIIIB Brf1 subunit/transcription initiation factor TFIIB
MMQDIVDYITYAEQANYTLNEDQDFCIKREKIGDKKLCRYQNGTYTVFEKKYIDIRKRVEDLDVNDGIKRFAIRILKDTICFTNLNDIRGKNMVLLIALSVYYSGMYLRSGVDIRSICGQLDVDWKKALAFSTEILPMWYNKKWYKRLELFNHTDKLHRVVHEMALIESSKEQTVKRTADKLYQRVFHYPKITSSKINSVIFTCVYISCKMANIKVTKSRFCEEVNMSLQTLNNYEVIIQQILEQEHMIKDL